MGHANHKIRVHVEAREPLQNRAPITLCAGQAQHMVVDPSISQKHKGRTKPRRLPPLLRALCASLCLRVRERERERERERDGVCASWGLKEMLCLRLDSEAKHKREAS